MRGGREGRGGGGGRNSFFSHLKEQRLDARPRRRANARHREVHWMEGKWLNVGERNDPKFNVTYKLTLCLLVVHKVWTLRWNFSGP